jgi:signal transduction histidine kinase
VPTGIDGHPGSHVAPRVGAGIVGGLAGLGALLSACAVVLALGGGMPDPEWLATRTALAIAAPIAVGLYAWREGAHARFGRLLILSGLLWSLVALATTTDPVPYSVGRVIAWVSEVAIIFLVLAFPSGRLPARIDRALVIGGALLIGVLYVPTALLVDHFPAPAVWATCSADCPANALAFVDATPAWVTDGVLPVREALTILLALLVVWRLAYRLRRTTPLMQRALAPVLAVAMLRLLTLSAAILARRGGWFDDDALAWFTGALALTLPLISVGFLAGLVAWRLYAADALLLLAQRLRVAPDAEARHAAIALAVKDPSLDLAFARPSGGGWVDARGWPYQLPEAGDGRYTTLIFDGGRPLAALIHDDALREQRAFVEAVGAFALVWDENERLTERVDSSRGELRASRARILAAADDERRRIERDLHDGGQQRLVALRIRLQLAEDMMARSPAGAQEMLHRLAEDVDGVLEELRALAAGVFPAALAAHGLAEAIRAASQESPLPVHVVVNGDRRYAPETETAAYFCCLEALQNVAKHATGATAAWVLLELEGDLVFEVRDDGPGFDPGAAHARGLQNMRDRVAALGGTLEMRSGPGSGTLVRGRLPVGVGGPEPAQDGGSELLLADENGGA